MEIKDDMSFTSPPPYNNTGNLRRHGQTVEALFGLYTSTYLIDKLDKSTYIILIIYYSYYLKDNQDLSDVYQLSKAKIEKIKLRVRSKEFQSQSKF